MNTFVVWCFDAVSMSWSVPISFVIACETWPFRVQKTMGSHFSFIFFIIFMAHPCMDLWFVVNLFSMNVFLKSQPFHIRFKWNLYFPLLYAYSTSPPIIRLKLSYKLTLEGTLHSRAKDFTTDNSIIIFSSNFKGRLIS